MEEFIDDQLLTDEDENITAFIMDEEGDPIELALSCRPVCVEYYMP